MTKKQSPPLFVLIGPTAVGKTALSLGLAKRFNGEIISSDSRLFYRGMDIGTAKPSAEEQAIVPHHMIDICEPDETLTLGEYQQRVYRLVDEIGANGRLPMLVGGTGQYFKAIVEGWGIPKVAPQPQLRAALGRIPGPELARWLAELDPASAAKHDPRNVRRIIRALEVTFVTGRPISEIQRKTPPPYNICIVGLHRDRETLYRRIDQRVDLMMEAGLLDEVKQLHAKGYHRRLASMSGLGYRQLIDYLEGERSLEEAVERIKFETHRFARQQATWFRLDDKRIRWFDLANDGVEDTVYDYVANWLEKNRRLEIRD
ncbi:MAG: tRNA (adenosine(37)-N6)-dimethylallyltransferase MiaA [Chloroflexota bacterium]